LTARSLMLWQAECKKLHPMRR